MFGKGGERWLGGEVDEAARDGQRSTVARFVVATGNAGFIVANFHLATGALWMAANVLIEVYIWAATRPQVQGLPGSLAHRVNFVIASALMTANWSATAALYWFSDRHSLQIVSELVLTGQLIHAQAFAFKSKAVLAVTAGIPALSLATLSLVFGGLDGRALASAAFAVILVLGHAAASARANSANAQALQAALEDVRSQAYIDVLTTLSNRRMFNLDFRKLLANSVRHQSRFALILIDLDGLKQVNDRFGHEPGDEILVQSSVRLRALIRATDSLARLGGDEFAILAADINDPAALHAICDRIVAAFEPEFTFGGKVLRCTVSVGVAIFPDHGDDQDALYKASDLALYTAKNAGRNTWRIFSQTPSA